MAAPISITDGEYRINGGAWTSASGTIANSDTLQLRRNSSALFSTEVETVVTVGTYSTPFKITTKDEEGDTIELQILIKNSYENSYYNVEDSRGGAVKFVFADTTEYLFTISTDIVRDNIVHYFTIPLSALSLAIDFITSYFTTGTGITSISGGIATRVFYNGAFVAQNTGSSHPFPTQPVGLEFQAPVDVNGLLLAAGDIIRIENKATNDENDYYLSIFNDGTNPGANNLFASLRNSLGVEVTVSQNIAFNWAADSTPVGGGTSVGIGGTATLLAGNSNVTLFTYDSDDETINNTSTNKPNPPFVDDFSIIAV